MTATLDTLDAKLDTILKNQEEAKFLASGTVKIEPVSGGLITFPGTGDGTNSAPVAGNEFFVNVQITSRSTVQWGGQNAPNFGQAVEAYWALPDGNPIGLPGSSSNGLPLQQTSGTFTVDPGHYQIRGRVINGQSISGGFYVTAG